MSHLRDALCCSARVLTSLSESHFVANNSASCELLMSLVASAPPELVLLAVVVVLCPVSFEATAASSSSESVSVSASFSFPFPLARAPADSFDFLAGWNASALAAANIASESSSSSLVETGDRARLAADNEPVGVADVPLETSTFDDLAEDVPLTLLGTLTLVGAVADSEGSAVAAAFCAAS